MPSKVYLDAPPNGDFRAMPARGEGFASLKWVTSFPGNSWRGLPVVTGALLLSSAGTGELRAIADCASITALRTGAAAALSAQLLGAVGAKSVGIIGCGVNGASAARCLVAAGYGPGVCADVRTDVADALAAELGWRSGDRAEAATQDVVVTVTPGTAPVVHDRDLRPGQHIAALGADARRQGRARACGTRALPALLRRLGAGLEPAASCPAPSRAGRVDRDGVTQIGDVILGRAAGRRATTEITLFDSTGLAIQDLAIAIAVYEAWREGRIDASLARL